jgi:hypothetical protein
MNFYTTCGPLCEFHIRNKYNLTQIQNADHKHISCVNYLLSLDKVSFKEKYIRYTIYDIA